MNLRDALEKKQEIKSIIKAITSGCYPEDAGQTFMTTESLVRLQLWQLARIKPDGKTLANQLIEELGLEKGYGITPKK